MSSDMISTLINQLATLLVDEAKLLGRFGEDMQQIIDELEHMKAFLMFAEGKEGEDPRLDAWISQVREVAYDVQDIVDEFVLRFCNPGGRGLCAHPRKIFNSMKNLPARHQISHEVQGIMSRLKNLSESYRRYQIEYGTPSQVPSSSRVTTMENSSWHDYRDGALLVEESKLVGIDEPKKHLISQLRDGDSEFKVVAVHGMGGLGKTTLVKKVTEDADVRRHFLIIAWVTVSQTYDMKELLKGLIQQLCREVHKLVPEEVVTMTSTNMKELLKDLLQDKRYLIVFDDVWNSNFWDAIKFVLPESCCGNRVMLTTRIEDVAKSSSIGFHSYIYKMMPLSFVYSYTLFCKKTFNDSRCPPHLEDVARGILRKCNGMPLAIIVIGGVLALKDKSVVNEWKMVEQSLGGESDVMSHKLDTITKILSLSYNDLPHHLKSCLLYASVFPEDYQIDGHRLIRFWISEGFVPEGAWMTKWEVGKAYLRELINRSLIQRVYWDPFYRFCQIHDLLREMILSKSFRQNFASIVKLGEQRRWPKKVRRLAIHDYKFDEVKDVSFKYLRSLIIFKSKEPISKSLSELLSGGCELLKVLDLAGTQLEEIPKEVFRFFRLKTLNLEGTRVKVIPKAIGNLRSLEFLNLAGTKVKEVPKELIQVRGLVQLSVYEGRTKVKEVPKELIQVRGLVQLSVHKGATGFKCTSSIGKLVSLEMLRLIEANEMVLKEIGNLKRITCLGISCLRKKDGKQLCSSLSQLSKINELDLLAVDEDEVLDLEDMDISLRSSLQNLQILRLFCRLERIPRVVPFLQALTVVHLCWTRLLNDPLESFQYLPNLHTLFMDNVFEGESLCFKAGCFLKLRTLALWRFNNLRRFTVEEGAMPGLEQIILDSFKSLEEFPWWLKHLTKLELVSFQAMAQLNDEAMAQLLTQDEENEDFKTITRIPRIWIWVEYLGEYAQFPQGYPRGST